jgi:hypothetical protein
MSNVSCIISRLPRAEFLSTHAMLALDSVMRNHFKVCDACMTRISGPEFATNTEKVKLSDVRVVK